MEKQDKFNVTLSIEVMDIQNINEVEKTFQVPFRLYLSWFDDRLQYKDLAKILGMNLLTTNEKISIWSPIILFENTNAKYTTLVDEKTDVQIKKTGHFQLSQDIVTGNPFTLHNAKLYKGSENPLIMERYYREKFICK